MQTSNGRLEQLEARLGVQARNSTIYGKPGIAGTNGHGVGRPATRP